MCRKFTTKFWTVCVPCAGIRCGSNVAFPLGLSPEPWGAGNILKVLEKSLAVCHPELCAPGASLAQSKNVVPATMKITSWHHISDSFLEFKLYCFFPILHNENCYFVSLLSKPNWCNENFGFNSEPSFWVFLPQSSDAVTLPLKFLWPCGSRLSEWVEAHDCQRGTCSLV